MPSRTLRSPLPRVDTVRPRRRRRPGRFLSAHWRILRVVAASAASASPPASAPASAGAARSGWRLLTLLARQRRHGRWRHVRRDEVEAGQRSPEECAGGAVRRPSEMNAELVRGHLLAELFGITSRAQRRASAAMRRIHQRACCERTQLLHHSQACHELVDEAQVGGSKFEEESLNSSTTREENSHRRLRTPRNAPRSSFSCCSRRRWPNF